MPIWHDACERVASPVDGHCTRSINLPKTSEKHGQHAKARPGRESAERPDRAAADKSKLEIKAAVVRDKGGPFEVETQVFDQGIAWSGALEDFRGKRA